MKTVSYLAAGGVVIDQDRLLLLDRPDRNEVRLPKGHVEPNESVQSAALRETTEESGYADLEIADDLGSQVVEFDLAAAHIIRTEHYFLLRLRSNRQVSRDKKDEAQFIVRWAPLHEAVQHLTFAAEQAVARRAIAAHLGTAGSSGRTPGDVAK